MCCCMLYLGSGIWHLVILSDDDSLPLELSWDDGRAIVMAENHENGGWEIQVTRQ